MLERELTLAPAQEIQTLEELASLLEHQLSQPEAALPHWLRILELEPTRQASFLQALSLSRVLGEHDTQRRLIEQRLRLNLPPEQALLLELRGDLLAGPLDRPTEALADYRRAVDVRREHPGLQGSTDAPAAARRVRRSLRGVLERLALWPAFLECIEDELTDSAELPDERAAVLERAADVAFEHIGPDAALPWLERLRVERPRDREVIARLASLHRLANRHHALLEVLDRELQLLDSDDKPRRCELRLERADIYRP